MSAGTRRTLGLAAVLSAAGLMACGGAKEKPAAGGAETTAAAPPAAVATADAKQEAQQIFSTRCSVCHGETGHGDGPGASGLTPRPRNYHDKAWQDSVKDDEIEKAIVYGGAAVGRSPSMIANPDLQNKPEVVAALKDMIRQFGKEP